MVCCVLYAVFAVCSPPSLPPSLSQCFPFRAPISLGRPPEETRRIQRDKALKELRARKAREEEEDLLGLRRKRLLAAEGRELTEDEEVEKYLVLTPSHELGKCMLFFFFAVCGVVLRVILIPPPPHTIQHNTVLSIDVYDWNALTSGVHLGSIDLRGEALQQMASGVVAQRGWFNLGKTSRLPVAIQGLGGTGGKLEVS